MNERVGCRHLVQQVVLLSFSIILYKHKTFYWEIKIFYLEKQKVSDVFKTSDTCELLPPQYFVDFSTPEGVETGSAEAEATFQFSPAHPPSDS